MPRKNGRLTPVEQTFATAYASTHDKAYAGHKAGMSAISGNANKALARPAVQAEIVRQTTERMFNEVLPLAVKQHIALLEDPKTPAGAKVQAVKLAYDRTLGAEGAGNDKQPHEMTPDELARATVEARLRVAALESSTADRARPILEHEASEELDEEAPGEDIFG